MKTIALASILAFTACAPVVWERPMTTPDQFAMDRARCQLTANVVTPVEDTRSVFHTASQNMGSAIADGIVEGLRNNANFGLCMEANGYQRRVAQ